MNPTFTSLKELRKPKIENLPDGRQRVTRWMTLPHGVQVNTFLAEAYGTADDSYTDCRLIDLQLDTIFTRDNTEPAFIYVFEEIPATGEVQVGQNTRIKLEDGREAIEALFLQFSTDTLVPGTVGTTTAPGDASAYLQRVEQTNDGTLRRIKRTYVYAGTLEQTDEEKNGGQLDIRTIVSVKTVPATPSGYTLVSTDVKNPNGLPVYTYTFAKGEGEISRDARYTQSSDQGTTGATVITIRHLTASSVSANPIAAPSGTVLVSEDKTDNDGYRIWTATYAKGTGTVVTDQQTKEGGKLIVYHLVALGAAPTAPTATIAGTVTLVSSVVRKDAGYDIYDYTWAEGQGTVATTTETKEGGKLIVYRKTALGTAPTAPAATISGTVTLISDTSREQDGYTIYDRVWAEGVGTVSSINETKEGGKLIVYRRTALGTAPSAPAATISGTVTLVSDASRSQDGYTIFDRVWAEGIGEVDRTTETRLSGMLQRVAIRHLTAVATTTQPTSDPLTGGTITSEGRSDQDGYRLWNVVWTKANTTSLITSTTETRNKGKLVIYRREKLGAAPDAPSPTILGTVVQIDSSERLEDGYTIYSKTWAEGVGTIRDDVDSRNGGKLKIYRKTALGTAPSAPAATISGTVTLIADDSREEQGVTLYDRTWAEGVGIISERTQPRDGGLLLLNREIFVAPAATDITAYTPAAGILVAKDYEDLDGVRRFSATWMQKNDGTSPITGTALSFEDYVDFLYPGRAKYYSVAFTTGGYTSFTARDVFRSPPVECKVLATTTVTYQTSSAIGSLTNTLWNPTEWATLRARWIGWANSPRSHVEGLRGYLAVNSGASGTSGGSGLDTSVLGDRVYASTDWAISLSGGPSDPGGSTWTLDASVTPAFVGYDGTQYYRKTVVSAAIPAQAALPV